MQLKGSKMQLNKPVACTLTNDETRARRALFRKSILSKVNGVSRIKNGLNMSFADAPQIRADVQEFIRLEQGCCGFLTFDLTPEPAQATAPLSLTISGPEDAQSAIDTWFTTVEDAKDDRTQI